MYKLIDINNVSSEIVNSLTSESFRAKVTNVGDSAEILIFDGIGNPESMSNATAVAEFLQENNSTPVTVRINSPGGLAFDGITIYNALIQHDAPVTTRIEGMAASAASIIAMAGEPRQIAANGSIMIHRAMGLAMGNAPVMTDTADFLNKLDQQIALTYAQRTGKKQDTIMRMMTGDVDGTVFTAQEALKAGFVDEILPGKKRKRGAGNDASATWTVVGDTGATSTTGGTGVMTTVANVADLHLTADALAEDKKILEAQQKEAIAVRLRSLDLDDEENALDSDLGIS